MIPLQTTRGSTDGFLQEGAWQASAVGKAPTYTRGNPEKNGTVCLSFHASDRFPQFLRGFIIKVSDPIGSLMATTHYQINEKNPLLSCLWSFLKLLWIASPPAKFHVSCIMRYILISISQIFLIFFTRPDTFLNVSFKIHQDFFFTPWIEAEELKKCVSSILWLFFFFSFLFFFLIKLGWGMGQWKGHRTWKPEIPIFCFGWAAH